MKNLGFGMMRLPVISRQTDFDYSQLEQVVAADGKDIIELVENAVKWLTECKNNSWRKIHFKGCFLRI